MQLLVRLLPAMAVGAALRAFLFYFGAQSFLGKRAELVPPTGSIDRVRESLFFVDHGLSPYSSSIFHEPPLVLALFYSLLKLFKDPITQDYALGALFIGVDCAIAFGLAYISHIIEERRDYGSSSSGIKTAELPGSAAAGEEEELPLSPLMCPENRPLTVAAIYLLHPYNALTCGAQSTIVFSHLMATLTTIAALRGRSIALSVLFALSIYINMYHIVLLLPLTLIISPNILASPKSPQYPVPLMPVSGKTLLGLSVTSGFWLSWLLWLSKTLVGSWAFIKDTYIWTLSGEDMTPNVGLFWYLNTEMFERFRSYFLLILNAHPFIYIVPLVVRLRSRPLELAVGYMGLMTLFKAYPSMGEMGYVHAFMALFPRVLAGMRGKHFLVCGIILGSVLLPLMWYLWLLQGSGNANFFYNQTLVYTIFNTLLVVEFLLVNLRQITRSRKRAKEASLNAKKE